MEHGSSMAKSEGTERRDELRERVELCTDTLSLDHTADTVSAYLIPTLWTFPAVDSSRHGRADVG
jgi:hypothetical protein